MSKYAVVRLNGRQFRIFEGKEFLVDKLQDKKVEPEVLLYADGEKVKVGKPSLSGVTIKFKIVNSEEKGEKIDGFKYKSKSRYRKHWGFRPLYTRLLVEKIS